MTTIACNKEMMAGDSLCNDGRAKSVGKKIYRISINDEVFIVGCCGLYSDLARFVKWYSAGHPESSVPKVKRDFKALVLHTDGTVMLWEHPLTEATKVEDDFTAIGTGAEAALGAMHMGADPKRAVEIACLVDLETGGPVVIEPRCANDFVRYGGES